MQKAVCKYWAQYKFSHIFEMMKNMGEKPLTYPERCDGKLLVITGATSGIGYFTVRKYASMGANIIVINRNREKTEHLVQEIKKDFGVELECFISDLSCLADVKKTAEFLSRLNRPIDVLIHNAGVYLNKRTITEDGLEAHFMVHYFAPFVINYRLLEKFQKDKQGRIILVSSEGYRFAVWGLHFDDLQFEKRKYTGLKAYGSAKLAQILTMHIFAEMLKSYHVSINAMHPGMVRTNTGQNNGKFYKWWKKNFIDRFSQTAEVSAEALYFLGLSPDIAHITDTFFHLTKKEKLVPPAEDRDAAKQLWEITLGMLSSLEKEGKI